MNDVHRKSITKMPIISSFWYANRAEIGE